MWNWSAWQPFPVPGQGKIKFPTAPQLAGVYELRHRSTERLILFGEGKQCAKRMRSLVPPPWGVGTRNNAEKRVYVEQHWHDIDFRTVACADKAEARVCERELLRNKEAYHFHT